LLARKGGIGAALALAKQVDSLARTSDDPRDPADAALNRAEIAYRAGDHGRASELIGQAIEHYQHKGATAYVTRARRFAAEWIPRISSSTAPNIPLAQPGAAGAESQN
jgi:hypothetical protein